MTSSTSLTLLVRVQDRDDHDAWGRFSQIYGGMIGRWLRCQHVQASDADDLGQETLVVVLQELPKFQHNGRPGAFRRWIRLILAHRCREFYRKAQRQERLVAREIEELASSLARDESALAQRWEREHDAFLIREALDQVAPHFGQDTMTAFRRIVLEQQDPAEVALQLNLSLNAVRIGKSRVLARLRETLAGMIDEFQE
jgi:RNA polymerase sigma-70 factor (ECF subfamily)